uniref:Uncharacterized protein n=1 Tax=Oryza barthii TaxID=65489 RepID=A0A0D3GP42_9ORYZ
MAPEAAAPPAGEKMAIRVLPNAGDGDFDAVVATFEAVLPSLLNHFYPLAGRIVVDPVSRLPELHCHNQGAELVVGEVDVALGSLNYAVTNESVKRLLRFACGSFSVVWGNNNLLHDGQVSTMIVRMWSELARTGRISDGLPINHDRSVFRPRSPPSYGAAIDAMFTAYDDGGRLVNALTAHDSFVERLYYIEAGNIARLRDAASAGAEQQRASRVQAVSAYLWKALAGVVAASCVPEERCCMGWWVPGWTRGGGWRRRRWSRRCPGEAAGGGGGHGAGEHRVDRLRRVPAGAGGLGGGAQDGEGDGEGWARAGLADGHRRTVNQTVFASFPLDTDFRFGQAALAMPIWDHGKMGCGTLAVGVRPGGDGSWLVSAYIWPRMAAALESDGVFKPLTAAYLGLV